MAKIELKQGVSYRSPCPICRAVVQIGGNTETGYRYAAHHKTLPPNSNSRLSLTDAQANCDGSGMEVTEVVLQSLSQN